MRSFTSFAGVQWPAQLPSRRNPATQQRARYSSVQSDFNTSELSEAQKIEAAAKEAEQAENDDATFEKELSALDLADSEALEKEYVELVDSALDDAPSSSFTPAAEDSTPWYLQVDPVTLPQNTLAAARQELPPLPDNPPPILEKLVEHVGVNLGLDNLVMLDLRALDPPPALGSNLIMLIGTARSEKHLHVSADRLCRWLRTNYKLRPDADGLLGRNELKLRLKRKAKKQRLVGPRHADDADDGVRTGWVCVNVGEVEPGTEAEIQEEKAFVGFGKKSDGVKIVVQMLVEEKRGELELERLWGGIARRQTKGVMLELDDEGNWQGSGPLKEADMEVKAEKDDKVDDFGTKFGEVQDGEFPDEEIRDRKIEVGEGNLFRKIST